MCVQIINVCMCSFHLMHSFAISESQYFSACIRLCLCLCIYICRCLRARNSVSVCLWESVPSGSEIALCGGEGGGELWSTGMETCRSCYRIIISLKTLCSVLHPFRCTCSPAHTILSAAFSHSVSISTTSAETPASHPVPHVPYVLCVGLEQNVQPA